MVDNIALRGEVWAVKPIERYERNRAINRSSITGTAGRDYCGVRLSGLFGIPFRGRPTGGRVVGRVVG